jgi:hypothetical protein
MILRQAFYGGDLLALHVTDGCHTGPACLAIDMHGAGTTFTDTAGVLGACQFEMVSDNPEQRCIRRNIDTIFFAVDLKRNHEHPLVIVINHLQPKGQNKKTSKVEIWLTLEVSARPGPTILATDSLASTH